jgi:hypothetical protein
MITTSELKAACHIHLAQTLLNKGRKRQNLRNLLEKQQIPDLIKHHLHSENIIFVHGEGTVSCIGVFYYLPVCQGGNHHWRRI